MATVNVYVTEGSAAVQVGRARLRLVMDMEPCPEEAIETLPVLVSDKVRARRTSPDFIVATAALMLALMLASFGVTYLRESQHRMAIEAVPEKVVCVTSGDSLWSLAEEYGVEGVSTSDLVAWLRERNDLTTSALALGQRLTVPDAAYTCV